MTPEQKHMTEELKRIGTIVIGSQWISVQDRLPENKKRVLVFGELEGTIGLSIYTAKLYSADKWNAQAFMHANYEVSNVTHWMPLPAPPGSEEYDLGPMSGLPCTFKDNPPRVEPLNQ